MADRVLLVFNHEQWELPPDAGCSDPPCAFHFFDGRPQEMPFRSAESKEEVVLMGKVEPHIHPCAAHKDRYGFTRMPRNGPRVLVRVLEVKPSHATTNRGNPECYYFRFACGHTSARSRIAQARILMSILSNGQQARAKCWDCSQIEAVRRQKAGK